MKSAGARRDVFLGWDVGAWGCDTRSGSQDAVVALVRDGDSLRPLGTLFRGNLNRDGALWAPTTEALLDVLLACVGIARTETASVTIAIDAALAWPRAFIDLLLGGVSVDEPTHDREPFERYLRRPQEVALLRAGTQPLSPVTDSIGNQSTKAIHVLRRLGLKGELGVWSGDVVGVGVTAIETYPSPARDHRDVASLTEPLNASLRGTEFTRIVGGTASKHHARIWQDVEDALVCAVVAAWFATDRARLTPPTRGEPCDGWIWLPRGEQSFESPDGTLDVARSRGRVRSE